MPKQLERRAGHAHHEVIGHRLLHILQTRDDRSAQRRLTACSITEIGDPVQHAACELRRQFVFVEDLLHHWGDLLCGVGGQGVSELLPGAMYERLRRSQRYVQEVRDLLI
jgi:hypothetical protein